MLLQSTRPPGRIAILGNAAGTVARGFGHYFPRTSVDAVEIDGELTDLGRRFFDLRNPRMRVYTEDARPWLERSAGGYDAIMVDAYRQPYIPFYLATREFFANRRIEPANYLSDTTYTRDVVPSTSSAESAVMDRTTNGPILSPLLTI